MTYECFKKNCYVFVFACGTINHAETFRFKWNAVISEYHLLCVDTYFAYSSVHGLKGLSISRVFSHTSGPSLAFPENKLTSTASIPPDSSDTKLPVRLGTSRAENGKTGLKERTIDLNIVGIFTFLWCQIALENVAGKMCSNIKAFFTACRIMQTFFEVIAFLTNSVKLFRSTSLMSFIYIYTFTTCGNTISHILVTHLHWAQSCLNHHRKLRTHLAMI